MNGGRIVTEWQASIFWPLQKAAKGTVLGWVERTAGSIQVFLNVWLCWLVGPVAEFFQVCLGIFQLVHFN